MSKTSMALVGPNCESTSRKCWISGIAWVRAPRALYRAVGQARLAFHPTIEAEQEDNHSRLRPNAVFGLVEHDRGLALHGLGGDFFATVRGEVVHYERSPRGLSHQFGVELVPGEGDAAPLRFALLAHRSPDIGIDGL